MSQTLQLEISDDAYRAIHQMAEATGVTPARLVSATVEREFGVIGAERNGPPPLDTSRQAARERFERHFGAVNLGAPTGADNESIDADLAREYADTHEGE